MEARGGGQVWPIAHGASIQERPGPPARKKDPDKVIPEELLKFPAGSFAYPIGSVDNARSLGS
ncbi:hypothetical protein [Archangium gephyra]|uniref:hypothetical protein n=1 Tax=Archangium gephyra TaxID=48 RepID=UPI0014713B38|nr:hypothetical protein [Archangium gephyra]